MLRLRLETMLDSNKYSVRQICFSNGERYPLLFDEHGQPLWFPTLYATTQFRNASKASNTMAAALSAIRVLITWSDFSGINLELRFARRAFLNELEIESLWRHTQTKIADSGEQQLILIRKKRGQESARGMVQTADSRVSGMTHYIRISYIADYLEWFAIRIVEREAKLVDEVALGQIKRMVKSLRSRRPQKSHSSTIFARRGLTESQQEMLLEMVKRGSVNNPFSSEQQGRNQLIVLLLYFLGLRAGELLALRISDFNFQENTLLVARRHDNPNDSRTYQPVVKTADRRIALSDGLISAVWDYVRHERSKLPAARKHEFLFVTHQAGPFKGMPLSIKGLAKIFFEIQSAMPNELGGLSPHVLRHTANDRFSIQMDKKGVGSAEEEKLRSYLMGWKEGSGTSATYTRRHTEMKAKEAALNLQRRGWENKND